MKSLPWFAGLLLFVTGCAQIHVERLSNPEKFDEQVRQSSAAALAALPGNERAANALVAALCDKSPTVRFRAAEALQRHLVNDLASRYVVPPEFLKNAATGLIAMLDDAAIASRRFLYWPMMTYGEKPLGTVRSRALLTLSAALKTDHGFDQSAWRAELDKQLSAH